MPNFVISTRNAHKAVEIQAVLPRQFRCFTLKDFPTAPSVKEDADSFSGNATKKAVELAEWFSMAPNGLDAIAAGLANADWFVLADDSGLEVDALNGAPGIHSARFASMDTANSGNSPDAANNAKLLRMLADVPAEKRSARFRCVMALVPVVIRAFENSSSVCFASEAEWRTELFEGTCEGRIGFAPGGGGGFGYDPLFLPDGFHQTFAELGPEVKNQISHRAKALAKLRQRFGAR